MPQSTTHKSSCQKDRSIEIQSRGCWVGRADAASEQLLKASTKETVLSIVAISDRSRLDGSLDRQYRKKPIMFNDTTRLRISCRPSLTGSTFNAAAVSEKLGRNRIISQSFKDKLTPMPSRLEQWHVAITLKSSCQVAAFFDTMSQGGSSFLECTQACFTRDYGVI